MKKTFYTITLFGSILIGLNACGEESKETKEEANNTLETKIPEKKCTYSLDTESVKLSWTAFKYTEKAGVGGAFDTVQVSGFEEGKTTIYEAVMNVKFNLSTGSTNTNNPDRDAKIKESFFGTMENSSEITGYIESIMPNGEGIILINMNGQDVRGPFTWTYAEEIFSLKATINVGNFNGNASLTALNKVCEDLHKGEDGASILWPEVEVSVEAMIKEVCE